MNQNHTMTFSEIIAAISESPTFHSRTSNLYKLVDFVAGSIAGTSSLADVIPKDVPFAGFGDIKFPYTKMGSIDSLDLFGTDELIIFSFFREIS